MYLEQAARRGTIGANDQKRFDRQVRNQEGAWVFAADDETVVRRFLTLGSEKGTFYVREYDATKENVDRLRAFLKAEPYRTLALIEEISLDGLAPREDPALFALALASASSDAAVRRAALDLMPKVCRRGATLARFLDFAVKFRGWGRGLRRAVALWFDAKPVEAVAFHALKGEKYGWTFRNMLRHAHVRVSPEPDREALYRWLVRSDEPWQRDRFPTLEHVDDYVAIRDGASGTERAVLAGRVHHESIPSEWKADAEVWRAMLPRMPLHSALHGLAEMTRVGALRGNDPLTQQLCERLRDANEIHRTRLHPMNVLKALAAYAAGASTKNLGKTWIAVPEILAALDAAFRLAYAQVAAIPGRLRIAIDVSNSMAHPAYAASHNLASLEAAAAIALAFAEKTEAADVIAFSDTMQGVQPLRGLGLRETMAYFAALPHGGTNLALPFTDLLDAQERYDGIVVVTDGEANPKVRNLDEAVEELRGRHGPGFRAAVCSLAPNSTTVLNPQDSGSLDCVGFGADLMQALAVFFAGPTAPMPDDDAE